MRWIIFIIIYFIIDYYSFQAVKAVTKKTWLHYLYIALSIIVVGNFVYQFMQVSEGRVLTPAKSYAFGFLVTLIALKMAIVPILLGEDIFRFLSGVYTKLFSSNESFGLPSRRKFISQMAFVVAALPFSSLLYGMYKGKYNYKVLKYVLEFEDLPKAFDGYQITQISDIHSGSFDLEYSKAKIDYGVDLINQQKSNLILFTGDLVNNKAVEMEPWIDTFKKLKADDGKFSVLGNHDYGDYVDWKSSEAKSQNLEKLKDIHKLLDFDLLLNTNRMLEKNGEKIALIGVENWGAGGFKKAGDLKLASSGIKTEDFKILMSHDPSHWEHEVKDSDTNYQLTLSGHTHGMQFGIEIPGWIKWSPAKWRYKYWAGIYNVSGRIINVNRGFGFLAYPGRVGIWPEITVITLKKRITPIVT